MKIWLDENVPARLVDALGRLGHEVDAVANGPLQGHPDLEVWQAAQKEGAFLITQDLDFSDLRLFPPGTHAGILLVRMRDPGRHALFERICQLFEAEDVDSWQGCLVVATDRKIRIRRA